MQEMAVIGSSALVSAEYGPLQTLSTSDDGSSNTVSSRKKKKLRRAGAVNYDEEESGGDEESGSSYIGPYSSSVGSAAANIYSDNPAKQARNAATFAGSV
jgi:hypothetical protein